MTVLCTPKFPGLGEFKALCLSLSCTAMSRAHLQEPAGRISWDRGWETLTWGPQSRVWGEKQGGGASNPSLGTLQESSVLLFRHSAHPERLGNFWCESCLGGTSLQ